MNKNNRSKSKKLTTMDAATELGQDLMLMSKRYPCLPLPKVRRAALEESIRWAKSSQEIKDMLIEAICQSPYVRQHRRDDIVESIVQNNWQVCERELQHMSHEQEQMKQIFYPLAGQQQQQQQSRRRGLVKRLSGNFKKSWRKLGGRHQSAPSLFQTTTTTTEQTTQQGTNNVFYHRSNSSPSIIADHSSNNNIVDDNDSLHDFCEMATLLLKKSRKVNAGTTPERRKHLLRGMQMAKDRQSLIDFILQELTHATSLTQESIQLVANDIVEGKFYRLLLPNRLDVDELPREQQQQQEEEQGIEVTWQDPRQTTNAPLCPFCNRGSGIGQCLECGYFVQHVIMDEYNTQTP